MTTIPAAQIHKFVGSDRPFYSGKHNKHGMNLQVIASPAGMSCGCPGALPGSVHDKKAKWIWGVLAGLEAASLVTLADKAYQGSSYAKIAHRGKNKPESQNRLTALTPGSVRPPRPFTYCRSARHNQVGQGSLITTSPSKLSFPAGKDNLPCRLGGQYGQNFWIGA